MVQPWTVRTHSGPSDSGVGILITLLSGGRTMMTARAGRRSRSDATLSPRRTRENAREITGTSGKRDGGPQHAPLGDAKGKALCEPRTERAHPASLAARAARPPVRAGRSGAPPVGL